MLLVHLSAPWALRSICKARAMPEMLSLVYLLLLHGTTNIRYKDPVMWSTSQFPISPPGLCIVAGGMNPFRWFYSGHGNLYRSVVIHLDFWQTVLVLPMVKRRFILLQLLIILLSTSWLVITIGGCVGTWTSIRVWHLPLEVPHICLSASSWVVLV